MKGEEDHKGGMKDRVKLEDEQEVKLEDEMPQMKDPEVYDLTGEGEFVLPSRKVGDTITIEDD